MKKNRGKLAGLPLKFEFKKDSNFKISAKVKTKKMEKTKKSGGKRVGAGRKSLAAVQSVTVKLNQEEMELYEAYNSPRLFIFLFRERMGLCTHGIQEMNLETGEQTCSLCGIQNPENFAKFFKQNRELLDFPPVDTNFE